MSIESRIVDTDFTGDEPSSLLGEWLSVVGFFAFTVAIWRGHVAPARGYEVSIYAATPLLFWIGIAIAASIGIWLSVFPGIGRRVRQLGYLLTGGSLVAVASIPVIRGYHFFGPADALTHLGWIRDIMSGQMNPLELLYPGMHTSSIVLSELSGLSITYSIELVVLVFVIAYVVFVPLVVQFMADRRWAIPVGLLFAVFFVPINNVSVFRMAHPATQAILLSPFLMYLMHRYLDQPRPSRKTRDHRTNASARDRDSSVRDLIRAPTWLDLLIVLTGLSIVFVHPQIALSIVGLMAAMSALQFFARVKRPVSALAGHRLLAGHTLVVALGFQLWAPNHERTTAASTAVIESFIAFFVGETAAGDGVETRGVSLAELGGSIEVLFLKLFGVSLLMCVLAGLVILLALYRQRKKQPTAEDDFVTYAAAGLLALGAGFVVYFLSSVTTQYFRQLGLIMAVVTVLSAAGLARVLASYSQRAARTTSTGPSGLTKLAVSGVILLLLVTLIASVPNLYRSPYMYQASDQVPESHLDGYEVAFDRMDRDVPFMGVNGNGGRYRDAIYGFERARSGQFPGDAVPPPVFNAGNYSEHYNDSRYLAINERDVQREAVVLDGLRYERQGFDRVEGHRQLNRVSSNRQVRVYYISPE